MTYEKTSLLFDTLKKFPAGATAKIVAAKAGKPDQWASEGLSKLALYGMIDRVPLSDGRCGRRYRYQVRKIA